MPVGHRDQRHRVQSGRRHRRCRGLGIQSSSDLPGRGIEQARVIGEHPGWLDRRYQRVQTNLTRSFPTRPVSRCACGCAITTRARRRAVLRLPVELLQCADRTGDPVDGFAGRHAVRPAAARPRRSGRGRPGAHQYAAPCAGFSCPPNRLRPKSRAPRGSRQCSAASP